MAASEANSCCWLSPDPLGGDITNPQSLNRYAYALNNPTTLTDPSGLCGGSDQSYTDSNGVVQVVGSVPCWWEIFGMGLCALTDGYGCGYNTPNYYPYSGGGSTGGGGNPPAAGPAPAGGPLPSYWQVAKNFNNCAAGFADNHSAASLLHLNNNPVANAFLGSATAAASDLVFQTNPKVYVPAGTNLAAGARAGAAVKLGAVAAGKVPVGGTVYAYSGTTVATPYGSALEMTPAGATIADTAVGSSIVKGAGQVASILDRIVEPLVLWDEAMYGAGEAACAASAF